MSASQVLTADQMRAAEQAIFGTGVTVFELMEKAAGGAAEWVRRIAGGRSVTVLCGPGNNGGDGYVIARILRDTGLAVRIIAPMPPKTEAAQTALKRWGGAVETSGSGETGEVLVDCLFGTGLTRPLEAEHALMLRDLVQRHPIRIAIDVPSGVDSDTGALLNDRLPQYTATITLGAWKFAHWSLPARTKMGSMRLVEIGIDTVPDAAELIQKPQLSAPAMDSHKYRRGMVAVVCGDMLGAGILSSKAALRAGAGYVKFIANEQQNAPADLVVDPSPVKVALDDDRIDSVLIGPGLGRHEGSVKALEAAVRCDASLVLDADALHLLRPNMMGEDQPVIATPHDGELDALCKTFSVIAKGRLDRAKALAAASGMVVLAKGPDTIVAAPDGRIALAPPAPSWLSIAGTGDVLAGLAASRMATGADALTAACEAVWLHGEAARQCGGFFTAGDLAQAVSPVCRECL
ncbi:MAG: NAD(P)H-hydrate dehydratase [Pseudomonadota bacterium]